MNRFLAAFLATALTAAGARAAVVESGANGFAIEETAHIAASPDAVYATLIHPETWWNADHTFSGNSANLSMDAKAGGCFCETWKDGSVRHATVVFAQPGKALRLRGPFGPFQGQGVASALTFTLKPDGTGTAFKLEDIVGGYMKGGFAKWPEAADGMLTDLVAHLKARAEANATPAAE